jgi:hypothetical protein
MFVRAVFLLIRVGLAELSGRKGKTGNRLRFSQTLFSTIFTLSGLTQNSFVPMPVVSKNLLHSSCTLLLLSIA